MTGSSRSGLLWGLGAYTCWGLVPLYFALLKRYGLSAGEILAQRIVWSLPLLLLLVTLHRQPRAELRRALADRSLMMRLGASASLLAVNWLLYIYATVTDRVAEASHGYFLLPLVNAALGSALLGERLRPAHYPALALVALSAALPLLLNGQGGWLPLALPLTFGLYSLLRKQIPLDSIAALTVETALLLPPSAAYLLLAGSGHHHLGATPAATAAILASGLVTVVPLLAFTLSLRRLTLLALSFLQFISPTVQLLLALTVLGEELTTARLAALACVWLAVLLVLADALLTHLRRPRTPHADPSPTLTASPAPSAPPPHPSLPPR
ncbi:EamA family transporter RarD [Thermogemmata fonticola]|uniref:EamA family transporter RarD n=1 Tax=Thermogemmata fonticola TaxID=2755323 RepID=A0A7V8VDS0_9BACT|nr:EamA family transporter RarD [Thermogemmata fonticola]MBA2226213.1 EamA family transporter RarD [Thermogemmata fonticola]